jgi:hypothetical protein
MTGPVRFFRSAGYCLVDFQRVLPLRQAGLSPG